MLFKLTHKSLIAFLSIFILYIFLSCYSVQQKNFVIDRSGILDSSQRQKLNNLYVHHAKITTNQIMLLTTDNFLSDSTIEKFSLHQFNEMGIGRRDVNNGVLIVFCAPMRKVRIATGFGTEKVLTANIAKDIIDSVMIPEFKKQKYFEGLWNGSLAITKFLEKPENKIK
ncbi:MAG TPA: TPM domain-containing protein [Parafilimonas sp.]|nr:TPM domain-containing protein [Parafilimonas sp.]